jgi:protoporphyrinogen oxidase
MLDAVIVGGGPAGLSAAHELTKHGASVAVLERLDVVGGLSRTLAHDGCLYDIGPHRFFTKNEEVNQLFQEVTAEDLVSVQRLTRILYNDRFFNYPLTPLNALFGVGVFKSMAIFVSYLQAQMQNWLTPQEPHTFEDWVTQRFGARLFDTFFKTYTEKVWGIPCSQIGADWAGQRIKGLSLLAAVKNALFKAGGKGKIKTLVDEFLYPRWGAGLFYVKLARQITDGGGAVHLGRQVVKIHREDFRIRSVVTRDSAGNEEELEGAHFLSSAPLTVTVEMMDPPPPDDVLRACRSLRYRDHLGVHLKFDGSPFPDNWIYVHDKRVRMARISNYLNFSRSMSSNPKHSPLTVEYFCFKGDDLWKKSDEELVALAGRELEQARVAPAGKVLSGFVVRSEKAYPVIQIGFQDHIGVIKGWLDRFENFLPIGRAGMFKYNNQDHAIATGLLAARTVLGLAKYDPWLVNIDAEYHESGAALEQKQRAAIEDEEPTEVVRR